MKTKVVEKSKSENSPKQSPKLWPKIWPGDSGKIELKCDKDDGMKLGETIVENFGEKINLKIPTLALPHFWRQHYFIDF